MADSGALGAVSRLFDRCHGTAFVFICEDVGDYIALSRWGGPLLPGSFAALLCNVSGRRVRRWRERGALDFVRFSGCIMVFVDQVRELARKGGRGSGHCRDVETS